MEKTLTEKIIDRLGSDMESLVRALLEGFKDIQTLQIAVFIMSGVLLLFLILYNQKAKQKRWVQKNSKNLHNIIKSLDHSKGLDKNLNDLLEIFNSIVLAYGYSFYILDEKNDQYVLRAVKYLSKDMGRVVPAYSGLVPFERETYLPPSNFKALNLPLKTELVYDGKVPLIMVPTKGLKGIVRIGPIKKINAFTKKQLDEIGEALQPVIDFLLKIEELKDHVEVVVAANDAMHNISKILMDDHGILNTILNISVKMLGAKGGFISKGIGNELVLNEVVGLDKGLEEKLSCDKELYKTLQSIMKSNSSMIIKKGDSLFEQLPPCVNALNIESMYLIHVKTAESQTIAGYWSDPQTCIIEVEDQRLTELMSMTKRLEEILGLHQKVQVLSEYYLDMLKMFSQMLDNMSPFTVGYSELMYRYSYILAKELNLEPGEIRDIATAAYLSNIGILGLSKDLSLKEGKFSDLEFELMKLHSDVGASIIEATAYNVNLASFIRHHHERMDGLGYPTGLKGNEIPIGSRIIAVVQTFLAKISGRGSRSALRFEQALGVLESAAGTQLDPDIVKAFVGWFRRKQASVTERKRSLGNCWEVRCSPESVCISCPAYKRTEKNCWEHRDVNCEAHGNKCDTCFIFTEYLDRKQPAMGGEN